MTSATREPPRDLVLVGGGHAHVQVLRALARRPVAGLRTTVVLDAPEAVYSGMVPGLVAGDYREAEVSIDVAALASRAAARVVLAPALRVDAAAGRLEVEGHPALAWDVASLDVGSSVRGLDLPGVREHALATRPIGAFARALDARLREACAAHGGARRLRVAVVGAGVAGLELAFCLEARLRGAGVGAELELVGDAPELATGQPAGLLRRARAEAARRGIALRLGARVAAVEAGRVILEGGAPLACDLVVWATGAAPPALVAASQLPRDAQGFVRVEDTLAVVGCAGLFAAGDCAALDAHAWVPRAGVHAVREGPVLDANLRAALAGRRLRRYRPQRDFLALVNLGSRRALGAKYGVAFAGAWVWRWKDAIDRRFVARFRAPRGAGRGAPG